MSKHYLGEIRLFAGDFIPFPFMECDGRLLQITQYGDLFRLLGTTYGGDGTVNFALPDLRGRVLIHMGQGFSLGQTGGTETEKLEVAHLPPHTHGVAADPDASRSTTNPVDSIPGTAEGHYRQVNATLTMDSTAVRSSGDGQPHNNMMPFLVLHYIIAVEGVYPG